MSDRYILWSDCHVHNHGNDWRRVEDALEVLDWVKQTALDRDIKTIFFLGDFFHVRGYMYPSIVSKVYHKLLEFKDAGLEMPLLVGNHDMPYKSTTKHNCLTAFNSIFPVVEQPMVWEGEEHDFYFLPYVENPVQLNWAIQNIYDRGQGEYKTTGEVVRRKNHSPTSKKRILLAHLDIKNAMYQTKVESTHGVDSKKLKDMFDLVITGHYHIPQQVEDNIWYVGSPYQQNFGEANQDKGIMIFDNGELEYVENTFSPKYLYVTPQQIDERITGNYVKITATNTDNIASLREQANQFNPRSVSVQLSQDGRIAGKRGMATEAKDVKTLLKEWVTKNANSSDYDKDRLYNYGIELVDSVRGE